MGRPVGISSNGEEGDGTGQRASGRGDGTLASSVDPNRKQWRCTGDPQAVPSQEGRLASLPWGDSHWGRASSLWPQVITRRGSAESWPPHSLADGERSPSILKGRLRAALMAPTAGGAPRQGGGSSIFGSGIGAGFGPGVLCIRILPFWRRAGWFGQKMLAVLCALG